MLKYHILITSDDSPSKHKTKMEQYAGDGTDLESLPTMITKIASTYSLVALTPTLRIDLRKGN